ncbi:MAG: DEAD/DEAH box helicase [Gammaproteobacteria bacterium]|nr:DEAD/DEAH box helicase [Gammaproteobacteria bacterium]
MESSTTFLTKTLQRADSRSDYNLYVAALEWNLAEPIIIKDSNDIKSTPHWIGNFDPYEHQINNLINFCRRLPVTLIADDVGLGKTISAGLIISELISRKRISKILIVAPKILLHQWKEELKCKFGIPAQIVIGSKISKINKENGLQVILTTYNSSRIHFTDLEKIGFEMLVLDEAHKLRNLYGVPESPLVARVFHQALENRVFKYVLMLTATPIQNRLWDIYSLIELLTSARGIENPFGSEDRFSLDYILDDPNKARKLKPDKLEEFRSLVYGYMSRTRKNQVNLFFPERIVKLIKVDRFPNEIALFDHLIHKITKLNSFFQYSLLQAYVSSPHALAKELENMAEKGSVENEFAIEIRSIVAEINLSAKLQGLDSLINELMIETPQEWRVVIFTCRRETQAIIHEHLLSNGHICGIINGDSAERNQSVIKEFNNSNVTMHIIISTEAGSEGLNLQVANVLVNYDLPWNPMIVEQRIGRLQRLSSKHSKVTVMNIILKDTFEEIIVGRLMEKIQMACTAIGDIESLLQPLGINNGNDHSTIEQKIKELVLASLEGRNVEKAVAMEEKNIIDAKERLAKNEEYINKILSDPIDFTYQGPRFPRLEQSTHSMNLSIFIKEALLRFENKDLKDINNYLLNEYSSETIKFEGLVSKVTEKGLYLIHDSDIALKQRTEEACQDWVNKFGGKYKALSIVDLKRRYIGEALLRIRVTVAYDSYEKLVSVDCKASDSEDTYELDDIKPINQTISNPNEIRISKNHLISKAMSDDSISEFCRFYSERLEEELKFSGDNKNKKVKLIDDLTTRINIELVGLQGILKRQIKIAVRYSLGKNESYLSYITLFSPDYEITEQPVFKICEVSAKAVPVDCLEKCVITGKQVVKDLLFRSEVCNRYALPEYFVTCAVSGRKIIIDEAVKSDITGKYVATENIRTSALCGKHAEPEYFGKCAFTLTEALLNELAISQFSGKNYRVDEQMSSAVSGKNGHKSEFIICAITNQPLHATEGEKSELSGKVVMPGLLETCSVSGKNVLPSELEKSAVSGRLALKKFFVLSSLCGAHILEQEAIRSSSGKFCTLEETKVCFWSGLHYHIDDLRICKLTGLTMHFRFINHRGMSEILCDLLDGVNNLTDNPELWDSIMQCITGLQYPKNSKIVNAVSSPDNKKLALKIITRRWFGQSIDYSALFFSLPDNHRVGKLIHLKKSR